MRPHVADMDVLSIGRWGDDVILWNTLLSIFFQWESKIAPPSHISVLFLDIVESVLILNMHETFANSMSIVQCSFSCNKQYNVHCSFNLSFSGWNTISVFNILKKADDTKT